MKWFLDRCLTGIAHLLSSQPGTPELYNFVALLFVFAYLLLTMLHWQTFDGNRVVQDAGTMLQWWAIARIGAGVGAWFGSGKT